MLKPVRAACLTLGSATALVLLAACGGATPGEPGPVADTPTASGMHQPSGPSTTSSSPSGTITSLADADPCSILTHDDLNSLGLTVQGKKSDSARSRGCSWTQNGATMAVSIRMSQGLTGFAVKGGTGLKSFRVGDHDAKRQITPGTEGCVIGIGVTKTSRVDVTVAMPDTKEECSAARETAERVEPHLPPAS